MHSVKLPKGFPSKTFVDGPPQQEALARMQFLVEQGSACGLLLGAGGSGKSLLLARFARQVSRQGAAVALVSGAHDRAAALFDVAAQWGTTPDERDDLAVLWRLVSDRLIEHRYQELSSVLLVDDAHFAKADLVELVLQLVASAAASRSTLAVILASRPDNLATIEPRLLELVDLRIELEPWQTEATLQLDDLSAHPPLSELPALDPVAVQRLHELSMQLPSSLPLAPGSS